MFPMEWFADYPRHYHLKPDDSGVEEAAFIRTILDLRDGQAVLDAPCGAGRISAPLAQMGLRVTGADLTRSYIQRARSRFKRDGLDGKFITVDMRQIDFTEEFDGAFIWQGSFGFFSEEENLDVIRRYARSLRPGGRLAIDQPAREWLLRNFKTSGQYGDVKFAVRWRRGVERTDTRFRNVKTGESWSMSIRHYTPQQYRQLFQQAGLELDALYCDLAERPYHRRARRIYVVGQKL